MTQKATKKKYKTSIKTYTVIRIKNAVCGSPLANYNNLIHIVKTDTLEKTLNPRLFSDNTFEFPQAIISAIEAQKGMR